MVRVVVFSSLLAACVAPPTVGAGSEADGNAPYVATTAPLAGGTAPAPGEAPTSVAGEAQWTLPPGWRSEPPSSSMRVAQFVMPATDELGAIECALFRFPGGGSTDANISRWVGQFEQPDGSSSEERAQRMTMQVGGVEATLLQVTGTFTSQGPTMQGPPERFDEHALFAAVFETPDAPHFLKCTGSRISIGAQAEALSRFVGSFRFDG
ncbi:MAG: hypothetical protein ACI81R_000061 [Bradymonadia bacterium]|jgi:hypothetical protein